MPQILVDGESDSAIYLFYLFVSLSLAEMTLWRLELK